MNKSIIIGIFILLFSISSYASANIDPEKKKLIDALLEQTGQSALATGNLFANSYIQQMSELLKRSQPDIPEKAITIMEEEVKALIQEEIVDNNTYQKMLYPIYDKHFSSKELKQIIEINQTPLGQKLIKVMPIITQEGMQAGQEFGRSLAPKIQQRITKRFKEEGLFQ